MNPYLFVLGRSTTLCEAELHALLSSFQETSHLRSVSTDVLLGECSPVFVPEKLMHKSAGIIKIATVVLRAKELTPEVLVEHCFPEKGSSLTFGVSSYCAQELPLSRWLAPLKQLLAEKFSPVRYVTSREGVLSSVVIEKQNVHELIIAFDETKNEWIVGKTLVVQDFEEWNRRDYDRPAVDPGLGMLPPKVARMMVNIALGQLPQTTNYELRTLLDPFCGVGTILTEGLLSGLQVVGSDVSPEQIEKSRKNLEWLGSKYPESKKNTWKLVTGDATHLSSIIEPQSIDMIVTEPFMGSLFENRGGELYQKGKKATVDDVKNIVRGLEKLYIGALKEWHTILKPQGIVALILPEIMFAKRPFFVKKVIDSCENLGYTLTQGPFPYSRPQAVVKRKIYILKKHKV